LPPHFSPVKDRKTRETMNKTHILISYFSDHDEARKAFGKLKRNGCRRVAWLRKTQAGKMRVYDPFVWRRFFAMLVSMAFFGALAEAVPVGFSGAEVILSGYNGILIPLLSGALFGILFNAVWTRRSEFGVDRKLMADHSRWLVSGETVIILQEPDETLHLPFNQLMEGGDNPPTIFVLHPRRENREEEIRGQGRAPLSPAQLRDHSRRLASEHRLSREPLRNAELLERLDLGLEAFRQACLDLSEANRMQQSMPLTSEWLLDNDYIFESNVRDIRLNLPWRFYRQLPALAGESCGGLPRIYCLARELARSTDSRLDEENILACFQSYQTTAHLSICELWAVPQMLRVTLIENILRLTGRALEELREGELADFWANRLITANRREPSQFFSLLGELAELHPAPSPHFASQLINYLHDEAQAMAPVRTWLERHFHKPIKEVGLREKNRQTGEQISAGNAFNSLRYLSLLDWKECFEKLSGVEQNLRNDPAGVYARMDFATRDSYRRAVEELHRGSGWSEERISRFVLELAARGGRSGAGESPEHLGIYLIGEKRKELARRIGCRETARYRAFNRVYDNYQTVYFSGLSFFLAAVFSVFFSALGSGTPGSWALLGFFLLIPSSQLAQEAVNYLVISLLPPRALPKMDFRLSGIPDEYRTLVVVPMMLNDAGTIKAEAEKLEIRYLANKESNLFFALYSDYKDAAGAVCEEDEPLLEAAIRRIGELNERHGGQRFFLFHRRREWSETEEKYIGRERKRGKLEELNAFLAGARPEAAGRLVYAGDESRLSGVRFVITLDSDTQLPHDSARRMIETLAHPLNAAQFDAEGRVKSGYTVIQPRVSASLPSANGSPFSRLFSDPTGVDPYTAAVSDVYQDLSGEGSYYGKGIYDPRAFHRILDGRFPAETLLSHDLIEGSYVRTGLASDIEIFDEFPQDYISYTARQRRWIRGDWQIADWILPRVPGPGGGKTGNPLSVFNRWKILDNLRRSLLPAATVALLTVSWLVSEQAGWLSSGLILVQMFFHPLTKPFKWVIIERSYRPAGSGELYEILRMLIKASFLPFKAWTWTHAAALGLYRRHVSGKKLLEWNVSRPGRSGGRNESAVFLFSISLVALAAILAGSAAQTPQHGAVSSAAPWLILWGLSPAAGWLLIRRPAEKQKQLLLSPAERQALRNTARRTWRYFSDFVTEKTSWLPPDNYQADETRQLAMRTSPTDIGLYLATALASHDFGYLTPDEAADRLDSAMRTISRLERYEGHLLNWYDIGTLEPLKPRYVSTVDSGNLLASLWTLDRGLESMTGVPLLDARVFAGLRDAAEILREEAGAGKISRARFRGLDELLGVFESPPADLPGALDALRRAEKLLSEILEKEGFPGDAENGWPGRLRGQLKAWRDLATRYFDWVEILAEKTEAEISALAPSSSGRFRSAFAPAPSLADLAAGNIPVIIFLQDLRKKTPESGTELRAWLGRLLDSFDKSKWLAGEMLARINGLREAARELSASIDMGLLYNSERRLFSIGFNVSERRLDRAFYDLLASEARLGSFTAIARGDIPADHWFAMSRVYGAVGSRRALLSWTGTMFEYLMPLLFQRSYDNSLLEKSAREAVEIQIAYGRKRRTPWGISECAFANVDANKTYQYQAFGVPELGLKRGLADKLVVAPYATLMAAMIAPREAVLNLKHFSELGMLGDYGYYEALDYSQQSTREGEGGVLVRAYMAHHQSMGFLALANLLHNNSLQGYFHSDLRVRAAEPLLHERIPVLPPLSDISERERVSSVAGPGEIAPSVRQFDTPHTAVPKTQLLSNSRYALMLTNAGGGYSRWNGFDITRWRSDRTCDPWGIFCYIREADSDRLWCNTYHPTGGEPEKYSTNFALDRAVFRRSDYGIESETEVVVSPEDDAEIRRITLINRSQEERRLELTSYVELALAPHNADRQHPAFNKLFITTEALPQHGALLAGRRPRGEGEPSVYAAHRFTLERDDGTGSFRFESDRRRFIGRGHSLNRPMGAFQEPGNTQGFVLDPILSLRKDIKLEPGERVRVSLVLAAAKTRKQAAALMEKYADPRAIDRAMDFAWTSAQLELRLLRIQPDDARRFQQLAGHLLYPNQFMRPAAERLAENRKGQAGLWAYSISGDLPIALIAIKESGDLNLVRQMLQAHAYWRMHGLTADLVILNEEHTGYEQPLREQIERLIQASSSNTGMDRPGGVYLRASDLIPPEDLALLKAAAAVTLVAARGPLPQQLGVLPEALYPDMETIERKPDARDPSAVLPFLELPYFNSLGGFTTDGREYAVYLGEGMNTPMPWVNVIANPSFGTLVSETGAGFSWCGNSQRNRLTPWSNDAVTDPPSEALYLRDEETGIFWTPTASPIREGQAYRARHGAGYTVFEHNSHGIDQELTVFVPVDDKGGEPVKLQRLLLKNDSPRPRRLSVTYYAEWALGESREAYQDHIVTEWDDEVQAMLARNYYHPCYPGKIAFAALSVPTEDHTGDRSVFIGRNGSMASPAGMKRLALSRRTGAGLDPCAALRAQLELAPGESAELSCLLGQADSLKEARELISRYRGEQAAETALWQTREWWDDRLGNIRARTPELAADFMINRWLPYQNLSCRIWGRSAFYQSGGAFGFRDQLQDIMAVLYSHPRLAREHILLAASRQFPEGDVQHWWHPPRGEGIRSRISDDLLWLPFATARYVEVTGDTAILGETIPFLEAPALKDGQTESYQSPGVSSERASLFEHCRRAVARASVFGAHGLPLIGTGDWNDGMNLVGVGGKGESVWLAWFLAETLKGMAEMARTLGETGLSRSYKSDRKELIRRVDGFAWDGEWYLRATFDDGSPLGSAKNTEAQIDSLPQSWAWLSGGGDEERAARALESAWRRLVREEDRLVLLFDPPYDRSEPSPGYLKGYPPGVRENGGQYTHAAVWLAIAMARSGDGDRAAQILRLLNPVERARDPETVWRYGAEPYVIAADVYNMPGKAGHGGWSWYTGSAGWMYRAWVEEILGLKISGGVMRLDPVIPSWWDGFHLDYRFKDAVYEIQVENPGHCRKGIVSMELDGRAVKDGVIALEAGLVKHRVLARMGKKE